jgi:hypothetical protein
VHERRALGERDLHVDDRGQLVVLDRRSPRARRRRVAVAGHDDRDAVTDVADLVGGERRVDRRDHVGVTGQAHGIVAPMTSARSAPL